MTWDHVPPKSCQIIRKIEQYPFMEFYSERSKKYKPQISQNGVKYRSICEKCNSTLGAKYDKALIEFTQQVGNFLKTRLYLPERIKVSTQPSKILRAICGHLLAAKVDVENTLIDKKLREFFLNEQMLKPEGLYLYYWVYPYTSTVVIRDFSMPKSRGKFNAFSMFSLLKFFPIAFLLTDATSYENLEELTKYCNIHEDHYSELLIDLSRPFKDFDWPEKVDSSNVLMVGQSVKSAIYALPRRIDE